MKGQDFILRHIGEALRSVFLDGRYADQVVHFTLKAHKKWGARDRRFFAETLYNLVRWWRLYLDALQLDRGQVLTHQNLDKLFRLYLDVPPEKLSRKMREEGAPFGTYASYPEDLLADFYSELGLERAQKILGRMNEEASVFLRVNELKASPEKVLEELIKLGFEVERVAPTSTALRLKTRKNVFMTEPFRNGWFEIQDLSSQQVAYLLNPKPGEFIIDACAGAGGKTLHIASLMNNKGRLLAMDVHQKKLEQLQERARRASVSHLNIKHIDGSKPIKRQHGKADGLLLDVPCSGSGVLKRNPDTKWKWSEQAKPEILELQRTLLKSYSAMAKPGGRMVYATCSVLPRENERQVEWFLRENPEWKFVEEKNFHPDEKMGDGFYAALMTKADS